MSSPHIIGKGSKLQLFIGSNQMAQFDISDWGVTRLGDKIDDGVCGEDRTRKGFETTGYGLSANLHSRDTTKLMALLAEQKDDDDFTIPKDKTLGIVIKAPGGAKTACSLSNGVYDDWAIKVGGQTQRMMLALPMRFDKFTPVTL